MKKVTNCPNCGAPVNRMRHKCEYCDTPYEDVPAPVYIDFKPSNMDPSQTFQNIADTLARLSNRAAIDCCANIANDPEWQERMLRQSVQVLPRVEPKVELIQEEAASTKQALDILWPMIVLLLATVFIPTIIRYFLN